MCCFELVRMAHCANDSTHFSVLVYGLKQWIHHIIALLHKYVEKHQNIDDGWIRKKKINEIYDENCHFSRQDITA